jgi:CheY-like chemotaxis protein
MDDRPRILICDDEPMMVESIKALLSGGDYRLQSTNTPRHALTLIHAESPDLVILDVMMPEMTGFELLDAVDRELQRGLHHSHRRGLRRFGHQGHPQRGQRLSEKTFRTRRADHPCGKCAETAADADQIIPVSLKPKTGSWRISCASPRRWKPSARWPAASPTTSTMC